MILIVTLNPLLERRFLFNKIFFGSVNHCNSDSIALGGKGLNVSRQLKILGVNSFNFFFSGGTNGKLFRELAKNSELEFTHIQTKSETRHAAVIIAEKEKQVSAFFSPNPEVSEAEVDEFKSKLDKMIQNCEVVVFSGSSPCNAADSIIPFGIRLANKYDKISVCDTYGSHLNECIAASPTMLHNNFNEIKTSLKINLQTENDIRKFLSYCYDKDIKRTFLTNGDKEFYASNFDYHYKIQPIKISESDPTGCGDCFVAGLVYNWIRSEVFEETLKFSTALAGLNASRLSVAEVELSEIKNFIDQVQISSVGKKTKIIDDSPHEI
ncbi:MAG: PfkB family carbohydrate kinase [Ignavibacteriales bacterium]|jgi:1-phosphofructokinase family hexose kinase|nr:MAG: 1-phosphofructokinase [Ignavibacterium sp.]MDX9711356.1 PfkB family carbohydrate kinase [Ignavibacteriaceae bacterium]MEB2354449.1 PfkB family carbohydrate kinase [Ignavibacteriales bacterium]